MNKISISESSPFVGNPSPEVDRGTNVEKTARRFIDETCSGLDDILANEKTFDTPLPNVEELALPEEIQSIKQQNEFVVEELTHLSFDGNKVIPYGYYEVIRKKKNVCKNLEVHELAIVRCPLTSTCDTESVSAARDRLVLLRRQKRTKRSRIVRPVIDTSNIDEQGGIPNHALDKMIAKARLTQRLSDNDVGGGLGKKKRLNRLIAQGSPHRYSGAKKKCPLRIEDDLARTSSIVARESLRSTMRDLKQGIEEQMAFGIGMPNVPVEAGSNTLAMVNDLISAFKEKKVEFSEEAMGAMHTLAESVRDVSNPSITHSIQFPKLPGALTSPEMKVFWIGGLLMITFAAIGNKKLLKALLAVTAIAALWFPSWTTEARAHFDNVVNWATERLNFFSSKETMVEVDGIDVSGIEEHGISSCVVDSIIAFMYLSCFNSTKWESNPLHRLSSFFSRSKDMRKARDGVEFTFNWVLTYIQSFLDWTAETFGHRKYNVAMDNRPEIVLFSEKVTACLKTFREGRVINAESAAEVMRLYTEGQKLAKSLPSSIEYQDARRLVQMVMAEINPLVMKIQRSNLHNMGPRIQPICIFLTGPPGVGKSTAMIPMMLATTCNVIEEHEADAFEANHDDFIYNRISENEFYDSYHGQMNVIFDDFGQKKDVKGTPANEAMELIRMVNSNAMDLHMAHLDDKGLTNFRSKMVWASSNVNKFKHESIWSSEAVTRRFSCSYIVIPSPGYRVDEKETNVWNMRLKKGIEFTDEFAHIQFLHYDSLNGVVLQGTPMSMSEVVEEISAVYRMTQAVGKQILETHEDFKKKYLRRRFPLRGSEIREEGAALSSDFFPIRPGESMTAYVNRLGTIRKIEVAQQTYAAKQKSFISDLDDLSDALPKPGLIESAICKYKDLVYSAYCKVHDTLSTISFIDTMKTVLAGLATFTAGYGIYKMFAKEEEIEDQSEGRSHNKKQSHSKKPVSKIKTTKFVRHSGKMPKYLKGVSEQLAYDATCDDIIRKVFKKNVYTMHLNKDSKRMGCITFIGGHDAFFPRHFAENILSMIEDDLLPPDCTIVLKAASNPTLFFEIAWKDVMLFFSDDWGREDIVFARFPNVLPQAPNIRKYIMEESEVITQMFSGKMITVDDHGSLIVPYTEMHPMSDLPYTNYINPHGYFYAVGTKKGSCGNLIFVSNPLTGSQKLIGQHVSGNEDDGRGFGSRISRSHIDHFDEYMVSLGGNPISEHGAFDVEFTAESVEPQSFKTLFKDRRSRPPLDSAIVPSPLYDTYAKPKCAPAALRKFTSDSGDVVDPWFLAREKYAKSSHFMNQQVLDLCAASYGSSITSKSVDDAPWSKKVFTFEEAVRGVPGIPNCTGIPRNTSAGYPYALDVPAGFHFKQHFFGTGDEYEFTSAHCKQLKRRVLEIVEEARKGNRLKHVYMDFLKDERRLLEKVLVGSTRLISACPVDLTIAIRMYFLDFMRWFMNNRIINGSAVGVNVFSSEWASIRRCLRGSSTDKNIIAGDFKTYDACQTRQIQMTFLNFVNRWYDDGNDLIRSVLFEDVCNSKHIFQDLVYEWPGGNPSGNPLTTIMNTFNNNVLLRYAGILAHDESRFGWGLHIVSSESEVSALLTRMEIQLFFLAYGDDNLIAVGEGMRSWYNQTTLTRAFSKIGFTYTSENKTGEVEPLRSIDDVSFLKRKWIYDPIVHTYVAALDLDTILEMPQWTKKRDKDFNNTRTVVETALKELSAHGDVTWNEWFPKIVRSSKEKLKCVPPIPNRRNALALQMSRDDFIC